MKASEVEPCAIPCERNELQAIASEWVARTFGETSAYERALRLLEECVELAQAEGVSLDDALNVARHVYSKPLGMPYQEVGGIGLTLLAYCATVGLSADECEREELVRVLTLPADYFRKRQNVKADAGIGQRCESPELGGKRP